MDDELSARQIIAQCQESERDQALAHLRSAARHLKALIERVEAGEIEATMTPVGVALSLGESSLHRATAFRDAAVATERRIGEVVDEMARCGRPDRSSRTVFAVKHAERNLHVATI